MKELLDELAAARSDCGARVDSLYKKYNLAPNNASPVGGLVIAYNAMTIGLELLGHYAVEFAKPVRIRPADIEDYQSVCNEKLISVGRYVFVAVISGLEYEARQGNLRCPSVLEFPKRRPYLRQILERSRQRGIIPENVEGLWDGVIKVRNCLVHNNGHADEDAQWQFGYDLTIVFKDGHNLRGTMLMIPRLTKWVTSAYADWCDAFLARAK